MMSIAEPGHRARGGEHIAEIGPLPTAAGMSYTASYVDGIMLPGAVTGVHGDATNATAEKGMKLLDAAVDECVSYVRELRSMKLPARREPRETPKRKDPA